MKKLSPVTLSLFMASSTLFFTLPALAEDAHTQKKLTVERPAPFYTLPGVKPAKPIVEPAQAEPDQTSLQSNPDGSFMVGKTRVKISGSIIMDIGNNPANHN